MKQLIFFLTALTFFFFSCSTNKRLANNARNTGNENFDSIDYFHSSSFLSTKKAELMIQEFPKHKHRIFGNKQLSYAWASFDPQLLAKINSDQNVDAVKFFLAAIIEKGNNFRLPTVVMQVKLKSLHQSGKGSGEENQFPPSSLYNYYSPMNLCPPPSNDCKLQN